MADLLKATRDAHLNWCVGEKPCGRCKISDGECGHFDQCRNAFMAGHATGEQKKPRIHPEQPVGGGPAKSEDQLERDFHDAVARGGFRQVDSVELVEIICVRGIRGVGTLADPVYSVAQCWTQDGKYIGALPWSGAK